MPQQFPSHNSGIYQRATLVIDSVLSHRKGWRRAQGSWEE